ncbi:MAG TPA: DUF924 family protein [Saccharospirillum sp.]|nr:DUF924 family protein [Saccharospirillum sp.]
MKPWQSVLDFWFGDQEPPEPYYQKRWFSGGKETDRQIAERFATEHQRAIEGELNAWLEHPEGRLALIILVDQFSRNLYRGRAEAFAWDPLALQWSQQALDNGHLALLGMSGRMFCLMPLMHAEAIECHDVLRQQIDQLLNDYPAATEPLKGFSDAAYEHRVIIEQFGRYPHRNSVLNRPSTPAEQAYLSQAGARFGQ